MRSTRAISSCKRPRARILRPRRVEMHEIGVAAEQAVGRGEAAFVIRESGASEHIDFRHVLHMHMRVGARDLRAESVERRRAFAGAVERMAAGLEKGAAEIVARGPFAAHDPCRSRRGHSFPARRRRCA